MRPPSQASAPDRHPAPGHGPGGVPDVRSYLRPYVRHRPEEGVLYRTVQAHWRTFLADLERGGEPGCALPGFVTSEMDAFIRCGILGHGFVRCRCRACGFCRAVAFSCQRRGFCPSCIGRRMCDTAARWVRDVLPVVPVRQWVLTVPPALRPRLAFNPALVTEVLRAFVAAVSAWLRRRARRLGLGDALKTGGVTVVQRFNSALDVAPHFHTLMLDGVYSFALGRAPVFHPTPAPTDEDVAQIAAAVFRKVERRLDRFVPSVQQRRFEDDAQLLIGMGEASSQGVSATGQRRGRRVLRVRGPRGEVDGVVMGRLCAQVEGFNLQAATRIAANDRGGLERMARYLARPPIANDRLSEREDGRLELRLKRPWRDGTSALIYTPHELLERLCSLVPRPRAHLTRYHGVLAPAFAARAEIVPKGMAEIADPEPRNRPPPGAEPPVGKRRFPWASLIWRVFLTDVLSCDRCGGRMSVVAAVTAPAEVARMLARLGLPAEVPAFHPARPPPQEDLPFWPEGIDPLPPDDAAA